MKSARRSSLPRSTAISILLFSGVISHQADAQSRLGVVVKTAYKKLFTTQKMCGTYSGSPISDQWRTIAYDAAEHVRDFFANLGFNCPLFENPEHICFGNIPSDYNGNHHFETAISGWGSTRVEENGIVIDRRLYEDYIHDNPKKGLSTLKLLIHHELVHLFIYELLRDPKNNRDALMKQLSHSFVRPYVTDIDANNTSDANEERLADIIGSKAHCCAECARALAMWCCEGSDSVSSDQLNAMTDDQLRAIINQKEKELRGGTNERHPYYPERAGYLCLVARELEKKGYKSCNLTT